MPKVRPLTESQRKAEAKLQSDEAFRDVLALYKSRKSKTDEQAADHLGWNRLKISRMKKDPSSYSVGDVRKAMHSFGATPEQWLQLGGFKTPD